MIIETQLAQFPVRIRLAYPETARLFSPYTEIRNEEVFDLAVTQRDKDLNPPTDADKVKDAYYEHSLLVLSASRFLLKHNCVVFHAVALMLRGQAWLLTAPSGTGKTTQYLNLKRLYPDETEIISGDKLILQLCPDGSFVVHPSPWPGKEGFRGNRAAALRGVVLLRQAQYNKIAPLSHSDAVFPLYQQFLYSPENETEALAVGCIESRLINTLPVYGFDNRGDDESSRMLYEMMCKEDSLI